jgi:lon-related putative ATP-dependent protease
MPVKRLRPAQLYTRCPTSRLKFRTTADLPDLDGYLGQDRAVEALRFGVGMRTDGYHMFVLGPSGTGRHTLVRRVLEEEVRSRAAPPDRIYVNNFQTPHRPRALALPPGRGPTLERDVREFIAELSSAIPAAFESDEYGTQRQTIEEEFKERQEEAFEALQKDARTHELALVRTPMGFTVAPLRQNEVMSSEAFHQMPEQEQERVKADMEALQERLEAVVKKLPEWERERRHRVRELDREVTRFAVTSLFEALRARYVDLETVTAWLEEVEGDIVENVDVFLPKDQPNPMEMLVAGGQADARRSAALRRYQVNVVVSNDPDGGAPVITEDSPTYQNLVGRCEHQSQLGALITDFTLIKPGALHRANGGYLAIDAMKLLRQPYAWEGLKRALSSRRVVIESLGEALSLVSTVSLEPEPIPLDLKVVLVGERRLYYLLCQLDPDFEELFKVEVDFEEDVDRTPPNVNALARVIAGAARHEQTRALTSAGVARLVEASSRLAGDAEKLSVRVGHLTDLVREANYWADRGASDTIGAQEIERAIEARRRRSERISDRMRESILRDTLLIDTEGEKVGQINGLAVLSLGGFAFGKPSRITARVRMGSGEVVDIERRVELGGPLHSKGVMILSAFLGARFAQEHPLSLTASLVFEQSYSGVDGDSASSTELYALLSALSGLPIRQGLAVTGSVNQFGEVQAIGGVNEKIEGFFEICAERGLSGDQGVLIPKANVKHLMLRSEVVDAVREGLFHVYPVKTTDEGIELLTGCRAGRRTRTGKWPKGTANRLVQDRLLELAHKRRSFGRRDGGKAGNNSANGGADNGGADNRGEE